MSRIAGETGAFCKLSGLVTESPPGCTLADLKPYTDHILRAFGPARVTWGSDWPVCLLRGSYADWHMAAVRLTPPALQAQVFGDTAAAFYAL